MPTIHFNRCQKGDVEMLDRFYENLKKAQASPPPPAPKKRSQKSTVGPEFNDVGNRLIVAIEKRLGLVQCSSCRSYLRNLNRKHTHEFYDIVAHLEANLPVPSDIRKQHLSLVDFLREVVGEVLPDPFITDDNVLDFEEQLKEVPTDYFQVLMKMIRGACKLPPPGKKTGDGVVYVGGGRYWPGIVLGIRMLRESGSDLPVEVWHRGEEEPIKMSDLEGLGDVRVIDTVKHKGGPIEGWPQKIYAIYHTSFERILFLDADAYVFLNPVPLFEKLETQAPFLFWKDLSGNRFSVKWHKVWPIAKHKVPQIQGGQLLIDVMRAWKVVCIAYWMNLHSEHYYRFMYGDQDTWRVVLTALNDTSMYKMLGDAPWVPPAFVIPEGIIHRCQDKLFDFEYAGQEHSRHKVTKFEGHLPKESQVFSFLADLLNQDSGIVFDYIYRHQYWGIEDPSGTGSTIKESQFWIDFVNRRKPKSIVDIGSGSGTVASHYTSRSYIGFDASKYIIDLASKMHPKKKWVHLDVINNLEQIPPGDVLLCKDVLHHWPNWMIVKFLQYLKEHRSNWKSVYFCFDYNQQLDGADCPLGAYRALDCEMEPLKRFRLKVVDSFLHKVICSLE